MAKQKDPYVEFLKKDFGELFSGLELNDRQKHFLRSRWLDQVIWMEKKSGVCRDRHHGLRLTSIILGVIVPILLGVETSRPEINLVIKRLALTFSGIVVVASSVEEFLNYGERWYHYRRTVESLKAQGWQFFELTGSYAEYTDHQHAFTAFADRVEEVIRQDVEVNITQQVSKQTQGKAQQPSNVGQNLLG